MAKIKIYLTGQRDARVDEIFWQVAFQYGSLTVIGTNNQSDADLEADLSEVKYPDEITKEAIRIVNIARTIKQGKKKNKKIIKQIKYYGGIKKNK